MSSLKDMQNSARVAVDKSSEPPRPPQRGMDRNKSGGNRVMMSRRPPGRSKSHKIGRPEFSTEMPPEPQRGVNRAKSGRLRSAPNRSRSFGKTAPDRGSSTGSLKAYRRQQNLAGAAIVSEQGDDVSVSDSVFTSASNQTLDSIALRKKQFGPGDTKPGGMRMPSRTPETDIDDQSLHTVDSIRLHHTHVDAAGGNMAESDMSVWSESFVSDGSYYDDFSDDDEDEDGVNVQEVEYELEEGLSLEDKDIGVIDDEEDGKEENE